MKAFQGPRYHTCWEPMF